MKPLQQQLKPTLPSYKSAFMLLFLFSFTLTLNAQSFYFAKGTKITIDENTTFFVTDSGKVNQARLRVFEGQTSIKKQSLNETKQIAFNNKRSQSSSKKNKKQSIAKSSKERAENSQGTKSVEFIKSCPDNFFSSYQQILAISASAPNIKYDPKFLIENIRLKLSHGYSADTKHEIISNNFLFFEDYHLAQYMTRPPPFEFYFKETYSNI